MVNYTSNNIKNALMVRAYGKPFYASDLGLNGGEIRGLSANQFIRKTGNSKDVDITLETWGGCKLIKTVEVYEWRMTTPRAEWERCWQKEAIDQAIKDAKILLRCAAELGYEGV